MMMGTYSHSLDAKGRIIIPARFREDLGEDFIMTKNVDRCLAIYPKEAWKQFTEQLEKLPKVSNEAARRLRRFYFGNSSVCEPDKQGRVLIPQPLRTFADLTKDIVLVGVDDHIEVWDSEAWTKYGEETDPDALVSGLDGLDL